MDSSHKNKNQVRLTLNQWGKEKVPFVFLIDFEQKKPRCWKLQESNSDFIFQCQDHTNNSFFLNNIESRKNECVENKLVLKKHCIDFTEYKRKFDAIKKEIEYGNSFLVNLTIETPIEINYSLEDIFYAANAKYKCWLKDEFVCFSPETFVRIKNGSIFSYPMKGTIDASLPNAKSLLLSDVKEIAEHATIVDLIRNDLSKVSEQVTVSKFRFYEEVKTDNGFLGQVSSEIAGKLPDQFNEHIGDIIFELLPAGSVSGAPKDKTEEIIAAVEEKDRGYYTGVAGVFDGENLDSCVLIRYVQSNQKYRSGGGITSQSNALNEYQEMIDKIYVPLL